VSEPFIGEVRMFGGNFAPVNWAFCNGQLMAISQNEALFTLIGTTYGGDGQSTFALPNLQGRIPIHQGQGVGLTARVIGEAAGEENVTLTVQQLPSHTHAAQGSASVGSATAPAGNVWASWDDAPYATTPTVGMDPTAVSQQGGNQPHDNVAPYLAVSFIISLFGIFPSQN
jgi:microcystin-dependent protein